MAYSLAADIARRFGRTSTGSQYKIPGPGHSPKDDSLSIADHPDNPSRIIFYSHSGDSDRDCMDYLSALGAQFNSERDGKRFNRKMGRSSQSTKHQESNRQRALEIWHESRSTVGTPAEDYMRHRCLMLPLPRSLRFHPRCYYARGAYLPAIIAAVWNFSEHRIVGIHRTYLRSDGRGKADVSNPKKSLGSVSGGGIILRKPASRMYVCEGIENALTIQQCLSVPTISALSASGISRLTLPNDIREIVIAGDNDGLNAPSLRLYENAAQRWADSGIKSGISRPSIQGLDWNDMLMAGGPSHV